MAQVTALFTACSAHLPVQDVREGAHDGVVFAPILKQRAVGFPGFHIAGLGRVAEGLGEDAFGEDLRIGRGGHIGQAGVSPQPVGRRADHHLVRVGEIALVFLIDPLDDLIQRVIDIGIAGMTPSGESRNAVISSSKRFFVVLVTGITDLLAVSSGEYMPDFGC